MIINNITNYLIFDLLQKKYKILNLVKQYIYVSKYKKSENKNIHTYIVYQ